MFFVLLPIHMDTLCLSRGHGSGPNSFFTLYAFLLRFTVVYFDNIITALKGDARENVLY